MTARDNKYTVLQMVGIVVLCIGVMIFIGICFASFLGRDISKENYVAAFAFFMIMLSMAFIFPNMLKGGKNDTTSTMRVSVYMIISVFVFLCVKYGWGVNSFGEMQLDDNWTYIIIAALGGKAAQSFSENRSSGTDKSSGQDQNGEKK